MNWELPDVQTGFIKSKETRDQIAIIFWITEKSREYWKNIYFFIDYAKAFECVDYNKLWKILKEMGIPDYLICLLRSLYAGQEATVRNGHGKKNLLFFFFFLTENTSRLYIVTCLFNVHAESIMQNARLNEAQTGIKIFGRNINNLRYADDTTLVAESKEELKSLLMKVKEES